VRAEVAKFMEKHLCKCPIAPETIGLSAGASAVIEVSSYILANPNDVVVIPAPSYPMYTKDLGIKSKMDRYDLQTHYNVEEVNTDSVVNIDLLDKTWQQIESAGKCFKILLISSPDNPTGLMYTESQLNKLATWCIDHKVHLIVNEIYGLSLLGANDESNAKERGVESSYASFAKLMRKFESDGLRIGVVHSLNKAFLKGYANANVPHLVSNLSQWIIAELLKNEEFIVPYILENKKRLNRSYDLVCHTLKDNSVPFIPAKGSFFIWADFSKYLSENTAEGEEELWLDMYRSSGVLLTPGIGFNHQKKGLFRIVFTAVPYEHLQVAMKKLSDYLTIKIS